MVLDELRDRGHEEVTYLSDTETGLQAIVALHDTTLGPALGGTRIYDYDSEAEALEDVLRLSEAMTYKAAVADLDLGGGKAVIPAAPGDVKTDAALEAYGRMVERFDGRFVTSVDVNSSVEDMDVVARTTDHVVGTSGGLGEPSPVTARGVLHGIRACVEYEYGEETLADVDVLVQGLGKVGASLAASLVDRGASVTVWEVDRDTVEEFAAEYDVETAPATDVYDVSCDVFAPCAIGGVVTDATIPRLDCDVVAGAANNVLGERRHAEVLHEEGILYAPDFVINAGGLITVALEYWDGTRAEALDRADAIYDRMLTILDRAEELGVTPLDAAYEYADRRITGAGGPSYVDG